MKIYETKNIDGVTTLWVCNVCGVVYEDHETALRCAARGRIPPEFRVGDLVLTDGEKSARFGWYDGDPLWVVVKDSGYSTSARSSGYSLIYVVTAITYVRDEINGHLPRYHLSTKAMKRFYRGGWTGKYHLPLFAASDKIKQSGLQYAELIGNTYGHGELV